MGKFINHNYIPGTWLLTCSLHMPKGEYKGIEYQLNIVCKEETPDILELSILYSKYILCRKLFGAPNDRDLEKYALKLIDDNYDILCLFWDDRFDSYKTEILSEKPKTIENIIEILTIRSELEYLKPLMKEIDKSNLVFLDNELFQLLKENKNLLKKEMGYKINIEKRFSHWWWTCVYADNMNYIEK